VKQSHDVASLDDAGLSYRVRILITHPFDNLERITEILGITPNALWVKGQNRVTPSGNKLPGAHKYSAWSYWIDVEDSRSFSKTLSSLVSSLDKGDQLFRELVSTGGVGLVILDLQGQRNIGDVILPEALRRLSDLKFGLGIEVFP